MQTNRDSGRSPAGAEGAGPGARSPIPDRPPIGTPHDGHADCDFCGARDVKTHKADEGARRICKGCLRRERTTPPRDCRSCGARGVPMVATGCLCACCGAKTETDARDVCPRCRAAETDASRARVDEVHTGDLGRLGEAALRAEEGPSLKPRHMASYVRETAVAGVDDEGWRDAIPDGWSPIDPAFVREGDKFWCARRARPDDRIRWWEADGDDVAEILGELPAYRAIRRDPPTDDELDALSDSARNDPELRAEWLLERARRSVRSFAGREVLVAEWSRGARLVEDAPRAEAEHVPGHVDFGIRVVEIGDVPTLLIDCNGGDASALVLGDVLDARGDVDPARSTAWRCRARRPVLPLLATETALPPDAPGPSFDDPGLRGIAGALDLVDAPGVGAESEEEGDDGTR